MYKIFGYIGQGPAVHILPGGHPAWSTGATTVRAPDFIAACGSGYHAGGGLLSAAGDSDAGDGGPKDVSRRSGRISESAGADRGSADPLTREPEAIYAPAPSFCPPDTLKCRQLENRGMKGGVRGPPSSGKYNLLPASMIK